jgi:DNA-binding NarL/FixJ family response regulator
MSIGILLVDDHHLFREGLRLLISREVPGTTILAEAATVAAALQAAVIHKPDLAIVDIHLPDGDGITLTRELLFTLPDLRILILSAETSLTCVKDSLRAGASGYLLKNSAPEELPHAIRAAIEGRTYLSPEAGRLAIEDYREILTTPVTPPKPTLSAREREVLLHIAKGLRTKEIAVQLGIGPKSAETYRRRLLSKSGCGGTADLVRYAIREGLLPPGEL